MSLALSKSSTKKASNHKESAKVDDNSIRVFARFRPANLREKLEEKQNNLASNDIKVYNNNKSCMIPKTKADKFKGKKKGPRDHDHNKSHITESNNYTFDEILYTESTQIDVFNKTGKTLILELLKGYNCSIIAFGQTGSGKTYTLFGPENSYKNINQLGLIPRCCDYIFNELNNREYIIKFNVYVSIVEVYKEQLRDLLNVNKRRPRLDVYTSTGTVIIKNVIEKECYNVNDILQYIVLAQTQRQIKIVEFDGHESSRSHEIVVINIKQILNNHSIKTSKLNFVDLAGSELSILNKGTYNKDLYKEAGKIHMGLMALEQCIAALSTNKKHIPYTDSKLTKLLIDSLGGNSKTSVIITLSPHIFNRNETIKTLRFGERTKKVKNKAKINQEKTYGQLKDIIKELNQKIKNFEKNNGVKALKKTIKNQKTKIDKLGDTLTEKDKQIEVLKQSKSVIVMNGNGVNGDDSKRDDSSNETNKVDDTKMMEFFEALMSKMDTNFDKVHKKLKHYDKRFDDLENDIGHFKGHAREITELDEFGKDDDNDRELSISATYVMDDLKDDLFDNQNSNNRKKRKRDRTESLYSDKGGTRLSVKKDAKHDRELSVNSVAYGTVLDTMQSGTIHDDDNELSMLSASETVRSNPDIITKDNQIKISNLISDMKKYLEASRDVLKEQNEAKLDDSMDNKLDKKYKIEPNNGDINTYSIGAKVDILDLTFYWHSGKIIDIDPFVKKSFKVKYDNFTDKWNEYIPFKQSYRITQYGTKCTDPGKGTHVLLSTKYGQSKYAKELRLKYGSHDVNNETYADLTHKYSTMANYSLMQGHIHKRNKWNHKKWTKRWFVLRKDLKLYYYEHKNDKSKKFRGIFEIKNISEIDLYNNKKNAKTEYSFHFRTLNNKRDYYFSCLNETDLIDWLSVLDYLVNSDLDFSNTTTDSNTSDKTPKKYKPLTRRSPTSLKLIPDKNKAKHGRLSIGKEAMSASVKIG